MHWNDTYRESTERDAGSGRGPFDRFVIEFLAALGRECTDENVTEAIKDAIKSTKSGPATSGEAFDLTEKGEKSLQFPLINAS